MEANDGNEEEMPSPGSIFAHIDDLMMIFLFICRRMV